MTDHHLIVSVNLSLTAEDTRFKLITLCPFLQAGLYALRRGESYVHIQTIPSGPALSEQTHLQVARIGHASLPQLCAEATESQLKVGE